MNTRAKGNRNELKSVKLLEEQGYLVYRVRGSTNKFNQNNDIFGLFDLLAILKISNTETQIRLIQVKSNKKPSLIPFNEFKNKYPGILVEIWVWIDCKGLIILSS